MSTATGPQSPPPAPEQEPTPERPVARGRGVRGTWVDIVRTMIVVLAFVALIVLLVPRPGQLPRPAVDVSSAVTGVDSQLGFTPIVPAGLPAGWTPTEAKTSNATDGVSAFHIGYITADGLYAGVYQASSVTKDWLEANDGAGSPVGEVAIDGVTWQQLYQQESQYTSLLLRRPDQVILITTKQGGIATATVLARALHLPAS